MDRKSKRCHGITRAGDRCRLPAIDGAFCAHHPAPSGLVTKSGFADLEGVTPQAVTGWLNAEIIGETDGGFIEWEAASRAVAKSQHISGTPRRQRKRAEVVESVTQDVEAGAGADVGEVEEAKRRYTIAKAKREEERARLAEMERMEEEGRLVDAHEVTMELCDVLATLRHRLRVIPHRMAPELATDSVQQLTDEIDSALHDVADAIAKMGGEKEPRPDEQM